MMMMMNNYTGVHWSTLNSHHLPPNILLSVQFRTSYCNTANILRVYAYTVLQVSHIILGDRDGTVVKVLRYKSEGRWFDSSVIGIFH
jgi:hypothetical protein